MDCPVCCSTHLRGVLRIPAIPVLCNVIWEKREDALAVPRGDVDLVFCEDCGHVFNQAFDPALLKYDVQYENSLHFSPLFQRYASGLAKYLVETYDLHGKNIIEIGSGKGDFLRLLCQTGGNTGTGFDPSYAPDPQEQHPAITFIRDVYTERYAATQADLVLARHVLEHIYQPAEFIQGLRRTLGERLDALVFFEVPNLGYILRDTAVWDVIYEHYSYFSAGSLTTLFTGHGFQVLRTAEAYADQFLSIEARPSPAGPLAAGRPDAREVEELAGRVERFAAESQGKMARWREQLDRLHAQGRRVALWGAGSKGISFLNMLGARGEVECVVDINPRKLGKYVTGAGQPIVSPEMLKGTASARQPDTIIVMNPIYQQEIRGMASELGLRADFLAAS
jgi:hypothetical protein